MDGTWILTGTMCLVSFMAGGFAMLMLYHFPIERTLREQISNEREELEEVRELLPFKPQGGGS